MRIFWQIRIAFSLSAVVLWSQPPAPLRVAGYLTSAQTSDVLRIVPAAPVMGDPRFEADTAVLHATRSLECTPRWARAAVRRSSICGAVPNSGWSSLRLSLATRLR
jgi:hypothetical protein